MILAMRNSLLWLDFGILLAIATLGDEADARTRPRVGIVTMQTKEVMKYANYTEALNRKYAEHWGYGFHILDHIVDRTRVPHWSKIHAVLTYLPEYDYVLWIDADAAVVDMSRSIEDAFRLAADDTKDFWCQDIWPDYPSLQRGEMLDLGVAVFRNSRWTHQFLLEFYHLPECQDFLNWTEQYCFAVAYNQDFMELKAHTRILKTPEINHHILPPPDNPSAMFVLHLAGRPSKSRAAHFAQVHEGRTQELYASPQAAPFWSFHRLFERHKFGGVASLQVCVFGVGQRHLSFLDAFLYAFPYMAAFTITRNGAPSLYSQMKKSEYVGDRNPDRIAFMDVNEYAQGKTRDGDDFVEGFYCDIFVVGAETGRHLQTVEVLGKMARSGLDQYKGEKGKGFGFSGIQDSYFVWLYDGCGGAQAASKSLPTAAEEGLRLDADDEDGSSMVEACQLLGRTREFVELALANGEESGLNDVGSTLAAATSQSSSDGSVMEPIMWGAVQTPGRPGVSFLDDVALARAPRKFFSDFT